MSNILIKYSYSNESRITAIHYDIGNNVLQLDCSTTNHARPAKWVYNRKYFQNLFGNLLSSLSAYHTSTLYSYIIILHYILNLIYLLVSLHQLLTSQQQVLFSHLGTVCNIMFFSDNEVMATSVSDVGSLFQLTNTLNTARVTCQESSHIVNNRKIYLELYRRNHTQTSESTFTLGKIINI